MNRQSLSSLTLSRIEQRIGLRLAVRLILLVLAATGVATTANGQTTSAPAGTQPIAITLQTGNAPSCPRV